MHIRKQNRRERALERFTIQSETQWNNGIKGNKQVANSYADYVERKQRELASLRNLTPIEHPGGGL